MQITRSKTSNFRVSIKLLFFALFIIGYNLTYSQNNRAVISAAKPSSTNFVDEIIQTEIGSITDGISTNIVNRLQKYIDNSDVTIDMSIYDYENLTPEIKTQHDKYLMKNYRVKWDELTTTDKQAYNRHLQYLGEKEEVRTVYNIANDVSKYYQNEKNSYKKSVENCIKSKVTEIFSADLLSVDYQGNLVESTNLWGAYAKLFLGAALSSPNIKLPIKQNKIGEFLFKELGEKTIDKLTNSFVNSDISREDQVKDLIRKFNKVMLDAESRWAVINPDAHGPNTSPITRQKKIVNRNLKDAAPSGSLYYIRGSDNQLVQNGEIEDYSDGLEKIASIIDNQYEQLKENPSFKITSEESIDAYAKTMPDLLHYVAVLDLSNTKYGDVLLESAKTNYNNNSMLAKSIANIEFQKGNTTSAIRWTKDAIESCNGCDKNTLGNLNIQLGSFYYSVGEIEKAKEYYKKGVSLSSQNELSDSELDGLINEVIKMTEPPTSNGSCSTQIINVRTWTEQDGESIINRIETTYLISCR